MNPDINCKPFFEGDIGVVLFAMFFAVRVHQCFFNLLKRHHNTNGSFCSTPPPAPQLGSDCCDGKESVPFLLS